MTDQASGQDPLATGGETPQDTLAGRWRKVGQDADAPPYPDELEFGHDGLYQGTAQGFTIWDVGSYEVEAPDRVRLSTATDRKIPYGCRMEADQVTFEDPDGKRVSYRRLG